MRSRFLFVRIILFSLGISLLLGLAACAGARSKGFLYPIARFEYEYFALAAIFPAGTPEKIEYSTLPGGNIQIAFPYDGKSLTAELGKPTGSPADVDKDFRTGVIEISGKKVDLWWDSESAGFKSRELSSKLGWVLRSQKPETGGFWDIFNNAVRPYAKFSDKPQDTIDIVLSRFDQVGILLQQEFKYLVTKDEFEEVNNGTQTTFMQNIIRDWGYSISSTDYYSLPKTRIKWKDSPYVFENWRSLYNGYVVEGKFTLYVDAGVQAVGIFIAYGVPGKPFHDLPAQNRNPGFPQ